MKKPNWTIGHVLERAERAEAQRDALQEACKRMLQAYAPARDETLGAAEKLAQFANPKDWQKWQQEERMNENTIRVFELVGPYLRSTYALEPDQPMPEPPDALDDGEQLPPAGIGFCGLGPAIPLEEAYEDWRAE